MQPFDSEGTTRSAGPHDAMYPPSQRMPPIAGWRDRVALPFRLLEPRGSAFSVR